MSESPIVSIEEYRQRQQEAALEAAQLAFERQGYQAEGEVAHEEIISADATDHISTLSENVKAAHEAAEHEPVDLVAHIRDRGQNLMDVRSAKVLDSAA